VDDVLLTAIAGALRARGIDDSQAVLDVADVAVRVLGRDRCVCHRGTHDRDHLTPVDRCAWCIKTPGTKRRRRRTEDVPTGGLL
jgi:hypothetical protein